MSKLTYNLKVANRFGRVYRNDLFQSLGLVNREAEVILAVHLQPGRSQDSIAEYLFIDKSGVARCLANLEERGLVKRSPCPQDSRVNLVELTEEAQKLVGPIREVNQAWSDFLTENLTPEEQEQLQSIMGKLRCRIRQEQERRKKP